MRPYVIGVDAGGTKTSACVFDLNGRMLCDRRTGAANFSEEQSAWENVKDAIDICIEATEGHCVYIAVGADGISGAGMEKEVALKLRERYRCQGIVVDDGRLALQAKLKGKDGVLIISGTGSVAYGRAGTRLVRTGGWGMLLDDRGSAVSIVLEAFRQLTRGLDEGRNMTRMERELLSELGCSSPFQVPGALQKLSKAGLAALAPVVIAHGASGEEQAGRILKEEGEKLAQMGAGAANRLELKHPATAVSGSILEKCKPVFQAFCSEWFQYFPGAKLADGKERVEKGALYFYQEVMNGRTDSDLEISEK